MAVTPPPGSVEATLALLEQGGYVADRALATATFLALDLHRPLFLEGEAGVGKTELARVLASTLGRELIRLPCHEGLDLASAVYEWSYARQMIAIRLAEARGDAREQDLETDLFSERFLVKRPLLRALEHHDGGPPVLLIDELDRADEPFEAFLLELLSDFQVTIPELGTLRADEPPIVVVTSNRTRDVHDALRRRCTYHWIDYPSAERELAILTRKVPEASASLSRGVVEAVRRLRELDLLKAPGVAESIEWLRALVALDRPTLDREAFEATSGTVLKVKDDLDRVSGAALDPLLAEP